jgi:hypothetical protein
MVGDPDARLLERLRAFSRAGEFEVAVVSQVQLELREPRRSQGGDPQQHSAF